VRIRTVFAALTLAIGGMIGTAGTAAADIDFEVEYNASIASCDADSILSSSFEAFSPDFIKCGNAFTKD
jgi:hypothetical protein